LEYNLSVIIPTYNGRHRISKILGALENQTQPDFETLVMVDGSSDGTLEYLSKEKFKLKNLNVHFTENIGRAAIRNLGAEKASGNLLVFYDDDMLPECNTIELHLAHHKEYLNSILAGAQIDKYERDESTDFLDYKSLRSEFWMKKYTGKLKMGRDNLFITGAHFSIPKNLFNELGGFDNRLTDAEDWDFAVKAFLGKSDIYLDPDNIAYHQDFITCENYIRRRREYVVAQKRLNELNKYVLENGFSRLQEVRAPFLKKSIISMVSNMTMVKLIDNGFFKTVLPKTIRYRLYDLVIVGLVKIFPDRNISKSN